MSDLKIPHGHTKEIGANFHLAQKHNLGTRDDFVKVHDTAARHKFATMNDDEVRKFMEEERAKKDQPLMKGKKN